MSRERLSPCQWVAEVLPWLLNGTLEPDEREFVEQHLAACESCRAELEETAWAWDAFAAHVPVSELVDEALEMSTSAEEADRVDRHIQVCESCRNEMVGVRGDGLGGSSEEVPAPVKPAQVLPFRRHSSGHVRRLLAMAAGLLGLAVIVSMVPWKTGGDDLASSDWPLNMPHMKVHHNERPAAARPVSDETGAIQSVFADGFESGKAVTWVTSEPAGRDS